MTQYILTVDCGTISAGTLVEVDGIAEGYGQYGDWYFVVPVGVKRDPEFFNAPEICEFVPYSYLMRPTLDAIVATIKNETKEN